MILQFKPEFKKQIRIVLKGAAPGGQAQGNNPGEGMGYFRTINGSPHFFVGREGSGRLAGGVVFNLQEEAKNGKEGNSTHVFYAGANGQPVFVEGKFKLMEAGAMIPSHDPKTFRPNTTYPQGLQERAYHRDKSEQSKVRTNARNLHPALVVNTNPDALNGPPIMNMEGHVLGGNSRAMSMQTAYNDHPEKSSELKEYLKKNAAQFGFSSSDIDKMKNPVIVRQIDTSKQSVSEQVLVRAMNEGFTQSMDPRTQQVAMSRRLDKQSMDRLASDMGSDDTLREFLGSSKGKGFIAELSRVGVIDDRNRNQYINAKSGKLNEEGKTLVEKVLVGKVINDADLLSNTKPSIVASLARAVPYMLQAEGHGAGFNIQDKMKDALTAYNKMHDLEIAPARKAKGKDLDFAISQVKKHPGFSPDLETLAGLGVSVDNITQETVDKHSHPINTDEATGILFEALIRRGGINQLASSFKEYSRQAEQNPEGQVSMFGTVTPLDVLRSSMGSAKKSLFAPGSQHRLFLEEMKSLEAIMSTVDTLKIQPLTFE